MWLTVPFGLSFLQPTLRNQAESCVVYRKSNVGSGCVAPILAVHHFSRGRPNQSMSLAGHIKGRVLASLNVTLCEQADS